MIRGLGLVAGLFLALPAAGQEAAQASGALLRGLDKTSGNLTDLEMTRGQTLQYGRLQITLNDCRYPNGGALSAAFAEIEITDLGTNTPVFGGWMLSRSPALNALDHARYDVWVLRCTNS
ncbi:DUF2155 domain-containing protein [Alphaproteobacteria bacterium KMM 3653]|uniref:DUF2155 domain-containing protein n=1 Tax=Harenicola maris TaxID=2841044 RepID=A0AAP2CLM7_9RHOB|nr:DUF2155 domain-containing protein [Harenicola maris]